MERMNDEQLLAASCAGDRHALAELIERYQEPLTGYLDRLVGPDWALAQDLVQETFLRVLHYAGDRGPKPFKPWLYTIATNLARNHFASAAVRHNAPLDDELAATWCAAENDPEEHALAAERRTEIVAALQRLSVEYRATLLLRFYNGMSLNEIAVTLDIPLGTVKSRLAAGLRRLRVLLEGDPVCIGVDQ